MKSNIITGVSKLTRNNRHLAKYFPNNNLYLYYILWRSLLKPKKKRIAPQSVKIGNTFSDNLKHTAQDFSTGFHNAEIMMENKLRHGAQNVQHAADSTKQQFQVLLP